MYITSSFLLLPLFFTSSTNAKTITITITSSAVLSTSTSPSNSYTSDAQFQSDALAAHNFYRAEHNASDLIWNGTSAASAERWARGCAFKHSGAPTGENLAAGYANTTAAIEAWALERQRYSWERPGFSEATGHFTQVVWRGTGTVGCGRGFCGGRGGTPGWLVVCEYWGRGNVVGEGEGQGDRERFFRENVGRQVRGRGDDRVEMGVRSAGERVGRGPWWWRVWMGVGAVGVAGLLS